jgi:tRNA threonylcarbamoyladenosine biosynthesis protein TsaE
MDFISESEQQTQKFLAKVVVDELKKSKTGAAVFSLEGDLGGGKTAATKGLAKILGISVHVQSPTFVIMKRYSAKVGKQITSFYHFDFYRANTKEEILDLGWQDIIAKPQNIIIVEWGDKFSEIIPEDAVHVKFEFIDKNKRKIVIK